jgi:hypothetical protein
MVWVWEEDPLLAGAFVKSEPVDSAPGEEAASDEDEEDAGGDALRDIKREPGGDSDRRSPRRGKGERRPRGGPGRRTAGRWRLQGKHYFSQNARVRRLRSPSYALRVLPIPLCRSY